MRRNRFRSYFLNVVYDIDKVLPSAYKDFPFKQLQAADRPALRRLFIRHPKNASVSRWLRCTLHENGLRIAPSAGLRFFIGVRLALDCDLLYLRWLYYQIRRCVPSHQRLFS